MTALSADAIRKRRNVQGIKYVRMPVATNETVYVGSLCTVLTTSGRISALGSATADHRFVGMAEEQAVGNTAGTVYAKLSYDHEVLVDCNTTITTADIGRDALLHDDNRVNNTAVGTSALRIPVGEIIEIESSDAWVWLRKYCGSSAAT